ncbi:hypothetical protein ACIREM_43500 [Streptomyces shenzhenensis]|uniref:hypothetical protein n=1 Tax=Streptomyces shenzhenensis TaxID=943815 RepID=UPI0038265391
MITIRVAAFSYVIYDGQQYNPGSELDVPEQFALAHMRMGNALPVDGDWRGVTLG